MADPTGSFTLPPPPVRRQRMGGVPPPLKTLRSPLPIRGCPCCPAYPHPLPLLLPVPPTLSAPLPLLSHLQFVVHHQPRDELY